MSLECGEYGQYIYETEEVQNAIFGEGPIVKKNKQCVRDTAELIVGGELAKEREFPHMALIGFGEGNPDGSHEFFIMQFSRIYVQFPRFNFVDYNCGGSLISEEWILSAGINYSLNFVYERDFSEINSIFRSFAHSSSLRKESHGTSSTCQTWKC